MRKMRKILIIIWSIILMAALWQSCKKSDIPHQKSDDPYKSRMMVTLVPEPAVQVSNGDITVTGLNDTTIKLNFKIEVPNGIASLSQTLGSSKTDIADAKGNTSYDHTITVPLSFFDPTATVVRFFLVDGKGQFVSQSYNVNLVLAGAKPVYTYLNKEIGGNVSQLYSRMDLDLGNYHGNGSINGNPELIPLIDVFMDDGKLRNNDYSTRWPLTMGSHFGSTTITAAQFDNISSDAIFKNLTPLQDNIIISDMVGKVILFQTNLNHKGLIKIISYNGDKANGFDDVKFDVKVQQ
jgi:hypothetical protein